MIVVIVQYTLVSLLIARTNFSEFSDDGIIAKNSTPQLLGIVKQILKTLNIVHANTGGYSTKSHRPQAEKEGGWVGNGHL